MSMWGQITNFVGSEAIEKLQGTVSSIARDLGSLDDDDDEVYWFYI